MLMQLPKPYRGGGWPKQCYGQYCTQLSHSVMIMEIYGEDYGEEWYVLKQSNKWRNFQSNCVFLVPERCKENASAFTCTELKTVTITRTTSG